MAVIRRKRNVAFTEFERQMINICKELKTRLNTLPSRYHKYLDRRIYEPANCACNAVILANELNAKNDYAIKKRQELIKEALKCLAKLQRPMLAYWNIKDSSEGGMNQVADMIKREFALLYGLLNLKEEPPMFLILPKRKIKELAFLRTMSELHKYCYQKIGHAPDDCADFVSRRISETADDALYHVVAANRKMPETALEAKERAEHIQDAINSLNDLQRPVLALWNLKEQSECTMNEWSGLVDEELKLLEGLKKADKTRYAGLK